MKPLKDVDPRWDETFEFDVLNSAEPILFLEVYFANKNKMKYIGRTVINYTHMIMEKRTRTDRMCPIFMRDDKKGVMEVGTIRLLITREESFLKAPDDPLNLDDLGLEIGQAKMQPIHVVELLKGSSIKNTEERDAEPQKLPVECKALYV
eukprot:CAMPEP_0184647120 /NCGR_PEP_ID=MMETSP0308-20130426/4032_1 /TAXON_ID=38269 /ORGANISM="Gloeochaete witrockiana, Strain SAG 46.84" /LENGTH=149 /DNA_ID=CAMNT_0027077867 /DNA_START=253 /DNA_END=702 /DNA_ORIENTATION=-